jgi:hypothetical protein
MKAWLTRALAVAVALASGACSTAEDRSTDWDYVHTAILRPSCATAMCHSKLGSQAGLDLSTPEAGYVALTGRVCNSPDLPGEPTGNLVVPGHPATSQLVRILRGDGGRIMPPDLPLPDAEIVVIENWILDGATCD